MPRKITPKEELQRDIAQLEHIRKTFDVKGIPKTMDLVIVYWNINEMIAQKKKKLKQMM
jgi:hypothetical protein